MNCPKCKAEISEATVNALQPRELAICTGCACPLLQDGGTLHAIPWSLIVKALSPEALAKVTAAARECIADLRAKCRPYITPPGHAPETFNACPWCGERVAPSKCFGYLHGDPVCPEFRQQCKRVTSAEEMTAAIQRATVQA